MTVIIVPKLRESQVLLPGPPVRMLSNNLLQAGIIRALQIHRVFEQMAMG
jgi:hypothetical protein